uniref:Ig-like domain-containing protein n=1 Tax=Timema poppense TaxID=170557 RepID=A0A7R9DWE8_TIMPO|nr:unnamed protein product [Timema poppensis]
MTVMVREPVYILDNSTSSIVVRQRESVQLECYAGGYPPPRVYWRRENRTLLPTGERIFRGNILTIQSVTRFDRGRYYCLADNDGNMTARRTVTLMVMFPPNVEGPTPGSENGTLVCHVEGFPKTTITWLKEGEPLNYSNPSLSISNYLLNEEEDVIVSVLQLRTNESLLHGRYTCSATNSLGSKDQVILIGKCKL